MSVVPFNEVNFLDDMRSRITEQFKSKTVIDKLLQLEAKNREELQQVFKDLLQLRSIDEARGVQLDIIGRIVGQPRELIGVTLYDYFAYAGYVNGETYGDLSDPSQGGVYYSEGDSLGGNILFDDETYRLYIKSKIIKNQTASTPEELISFVSFLFGQDTPIYLVEGDAHINIFIGRELSALEINLLNFTSYEAGYPTRLIPKTVGVSLNYSSFIPGSFGFLGVPSAGGFSDYNTGTGGGRFLSL